MKGRKEGRKEGRKGEGGNWIAGLVIVEEDRDD